MPSIHPLTLEKSQNSIALLAFALFSGLGIANYNALSKIGYKGLGMEFMKEIQDAKELALEEIDADVRQQKESIKLLISSANQTKDELVGQKKAIESLNAKAEATKVEIEETYQIIRDITSSLAKLTLLQVMTKNEFGTERANRALEETANELNQLLTKLLPDPKQRDEWMKNILTKVPPVEPKR